MENKMSERTETLIKLIPHPEIQVQVKDLLQKETALFAPESPEVLERIHFAVIKLAMEGPQQFQLASHFYQIDVRDLLVNAGFAEDIDGHNKWGEKMLSNK